MNNKTIKCRDCGKEVEVKLSNNPRYKRKYCDKCSKERKKSWDNLWKVKIEDCEDEE
ncbi:cytochrome C551 [Candidatus Pacearchaeota archaeon]|nr:cytochrome C551 [Candidatus Pacearchaeota archaeon]